MLRHVFLGLALCFAASLSFANSPAPIPVKAFFSYSEFSSPKISPDGKYLAMVVSDDDTGEDRKLLAIIGTDDRKIKTSFKVSEGNEIWEFWWANNERVLIATATETGALSVATPDGSLYGINVDKTQSLQVLGQITQNGNEQKKEPMHDTTDNFTHIKHGELKRETPKTYFFDNMLFIPHDNAHHVLVQGRAMDSSRMQVLDVDIYTGSVQVVVTSPTSGGGFFTDKDGKVRIAWGIDSFNGDPQFFYRDASESAKWQDMSSLYKDIDPAVDESGPLGMTQDGKTFYWRGRTPDGTLGLYSINPSDMSEQNLYSNPVLDMDEYIYGDFADNRYKILAVETFPGLPDLHFIDKKDPETAVLLALRQAFPGQQVTITSASQDGRLMIVFTGSDRNPGNYYLFNIKTMKADILFSVLDEIDPDKMSPMRPVTLKARDGVTLNGYLTTPLGLPAKNLPLILLPHGGPHGIRNYWGWDDEVQFLANRGYAVLQINYRGSDGYGRKFQDLGYQHWGTTMQDDLADAVRWSVQQGIADPSRVCIYGASYGGYAALESVIRYPTLYKCAAGYVGVYDLTLQGKYSDTSRSAEGRNYLNVVLGDNKPILRMYSPVYNVDKINVPVFIAYGGKDQRVVPDNADELIDAMKKAGKNYQVLFKPYEAHGFMKPQDKFEFYTELLQFFNKYTSPDGSSTIKPGTSVH